MIAPTPDELHGWPVTISVPQAGRCFGLGRDASYRWAREGGMPGVIEVGRRLVVVTSHLLEALGVGPPDGESRPDDQPGGSPPNRAPTTEGTDQGEGSLLRSLTGESGKASS